MAPQIGYHVNDVLSESHGNLTLTILQPSQSTWLDEGYPQACTNDVLIISTAASTILGSTTCPSLRDLFEIDGTITPQNTSDDGEEFSEFVSASTDPLQQPVFATTHEEDEIQSLLITDSVTGVEFGEIAGIGIIQPAFARLDNSTRRVRQAGKSLERKWQILRNMRLARPQSRDESVAAFDPPAPQISHEKLAKFAREPSRTTAAIKQQQANHREFAADSLDWVMRPVSFATPVSKETQQELYRSPTKCRG